MLHVDFIRLRNILTKHSEDLTETDELRILEQPDIQKKVKCGLHVVKKDIFKLSEDSDRAAMSHLHVQNRNQ